MPEQNQSHHNVWVGLICGMFFAGVIIAVGGPPLLAVISGGVAVAAGTLQ